MANNFKKNIIDRGLFKQIGSHFLDNAMGTDYLQRRNNVEYAVGNSDCLFWIELGGDRW